MTGGAGLSCREIVEIISDYLEGALDVPTRAQVEAHLAVCPGCGHYLAQMRSTVALLGQVTPETLPAETVAGLVEAFRALRPG